MISNHTKGGKLPEGGATTSILLTYSLNIVIIVSSMGQGVSSSSQGGEREKEMRRFGMARLLTCLG